MTMTFTETVDVDPALIHDRARLVALYEKLTARVDQELALDAPDMRVLPELTKLVMEVAVALAKTQPVPEKSATLCCHDPLQAVDRAHAGVALESATAAVRVCWATPKTEEEAIALVTLIRHLAASSVERAVDEIARQATITADGFVYTTPEAWGRYQTLCDKLAATAAPPKG